MFSEWSCDSGVLSIVIQNKIVVDMSVLVCKKGLLIVKLCIYEDGNVVLPILARIKQKCGF